MKTNRKNTSWHRRRPNARFVFIINRIKYLILFIFIKIRYARKKLFKRIIKETTHLKERQTLDTQAPINIRTDDFLKTIYEQCNSVYIAFVQIRFQMISMLVSNAIMFYFIYSLKIRTQRLVITISVAAIIVSWVLYLIDKKNFYIFRRANTISKRIEAYLNIPLEMRLHTIHTKDLTFYKLSHSTIITVFTILLTAFWILLMFFHDFLFEGQPIKEGSTAVPVTQIA